ncbi:hypothetical protein SKA34_08428 [Photobacterium sp. SKA34]|nr:hypothetical protein SKA34_08428 [Photobacterium sp. SKA34]
MQSVKNNIFFFSNFAENPRPSCDTPGIVRDVNAALNLLEKGILEFKAAGRLCHFIHYLSRVIMYKEYVGEEKLSLQVINADDIQAPMIKAVTLIHVRDERLVMFPVFIKRHLIKMDEYRRIAQVF